MRREVSLGVKRFGRSRRGPVLAKAGLSLYQDAAQTLRKERYGCDDNPKRYILTNKGPPV